MPQKPAEQSMVVVKANPKQGRATMDGDFSYPQSSYLLEYMMVTNRTLFQEDRVFKFHVNAHHLKQVIVECMIPMFKHRQLLSSMHIFAYHVSHFLLGVALITPHLNSMSSIWHTFAYNIDLQAHALINRYPLWSGGVHLAARDSEYC